MKTFPPLDPLTEKRLPPCDDSDSSRVRAAFNAEIDPRLGELILEMHRLAFGPLIQGHDEPDDFAKMADDFGKLATTALLIGDISFFDQVRHAISYGKAPNEAHNLRQNSRAMAAYFRAKLAQPPITNGGAYFWGVGTPHASQVALALDRMEGRPSGTTEESTVVDLMNRKAVSLPLAKGKRGRKKPPEK
jgi:hypothetical protein